MQLENVDVAELATEPEVSMPKQDEDDWQKRQPTGGGGTAACKPRQGTPLSRHTGGGLFAFCACGRMFPALELPAAESVSMVVVFLLRLFANRDWKQRGDKLIIAYDDMCHLLRFIEGRAHMHPKLQMFMEQVRPGLTAGWDGVFAGFSVLLGIGV